MRNKTNMNSVIPRRRFCQWLTAAPLLPRTVWPQTRARVVLAHLDKVRNNRQAILADELLSLLDRAMEGYFQCTVAQAWKKVVTPQDTVGLKVNALAGRRLSTHPELVQAICERIQQSGVPAERIIIWDRMNRDLESAGYKINTTAKEPQCYGNDACGYSQEIVEFGLAGSRISRIVTEQCTVLINLPVLKDHGIVGITAGLKNFFGAIDNPNKYHDSCGDPYVADVNMFAPIRRKHRLTICDALTAQYEGGPPFMAQWSWPMNSLLISNDMVALDRIGWDLIEAKRREQKLPSLREAGREPKYIFTAADREHGLGIVERERIDVVTV